MITVIPGQPFPEPQRSTTPAPMDGGGRQYTLRNSDHGAAPAKPRPPREPKVEMPNCGGLSQKEKADICRAANRAFDYLLETGELTLSTSMSRTNQAIEFRRLEIRTHFRIASLLDADHQQFNDICAHFENMVPEDAGKAFERSMKGDGDANKKRIALFKIKEACEAAKLPYPAYPLSMAASKFKVRTLDQLSPKQAWVIFYDMTSRSRKHVAGTVRKRPKVDSDNCPF